MKRRTALLLILAAPALVGEQAVRNVILFIGDAAGLPTMNAASMYGYKEPKRLYLQSMPHIGLMDTTSASSLVTDSAAGMTAIVTGVKTHNGVISQSASAVRGKKDGHRLKTILEYAEEKGLSTGVVSNSSIASATPAACYAHANDRKKVGEIFAQVLTPAFGDGVDVMIGPGREEILSETAKLGLDLGTAMPKHGMPLFESLDAVPQGERRAAVLLNSSDFDLAKATELAIDMLSRNPRGFFLMVESDCHTDDLLQGLRRTVDLDKLIRRTAGRMNDEETLVIFAADHSYDFRIHDGDAGEPLISESEAASLDADADSVQLRNVRRDDDHTGEEVVVAAQGPGAERVRGFFLNTDLFDIMMAAYGWVAAPSNGEK